MVSWMNNSRKKLKNDIILIAAVLATGVLLLFLNTFFQQPGATVKVISGREVSGIYELGTDREIIINAGGGYNLIKIAGGKAKMKEANCPGGDCMAQGPIDKTGSQIACLPNKVLIRVEGADESAPDSIVH